MTYAGQQLTTGKQAECYANKFIGLHLKGIAGGKTYADLGDAADRSCKAQVAAGRSRPTPPNLADLQKQLADVTAQRETVFKGETLRGLLLTSYGFSEFGAKAGQAATRDVPRRGAAAPAVARRPAARLPDPARPRRSPPR